MGNILDTIVKSRKISLAASQKRLSLSAIKSKLKKIQPPLDFECAVSKKPYSVIGEIKKSSPTQGTILKRFSPAILAGIYKRAGVSAISVLTEENHFGGSPDDILKVKERTGLPVLRKDFIFSEYQIYESRYFRADAVLLIARILGKKKLAELFNLTVKLGMTPLVEIYGMKDIAKLNGLRISLLGINTRDLATGKINKSKAGELAKKVKAKVLVCESGMKNRKDIDEMRNLGFNSFLVGTSILKSGNKFVFIRGLLEN